MNQENHSYDRVSASRADRQDRLCFDKCSAGSKASRMSPERIGKSISVLAEIEEIITEMRWNASSRGIDYRHTAALREACARLNPPISLSTFYRYRTLYCEYHFAEVKDWLRYLDRSLDRKERK
jgi:hypothetical protein